MNWYYANAGQPVGPISDADFQSLVQAGTVKPDTLVWREGMANWLPYATVASAGGAVTTTSAVAQSDTSQTSAAPESSQTASESSTSATASAGGLVCAECGGTFARDQVIQYGSVNVCTGCKPAFLQKLRAGILTGSPGSQTKEQLLERDYDVPIGDYLSQAWAMFKARAGLMIGVTAVVGLLFLIVNGTPYLSLILSMVLNGPIMGGYWLFLLRSARGEEATFGDAFSGFSPRFGQLLLAYLMPTVIGIAIILPVAIVAGIVFGGLAMFAKGGGGNPTTLFVIAGVLVGLLMLATVAVMAYFNICWLFTVPLVADKGINFWSAMGISRQVVKKHWWRTFWLSIVCGLINILGVLTCLVGLLVTVPVSMGILAVHFQRVFGELSPGER